MRIGTMQHIELRMYDDAQDKFKIPEYAAGTY